MSALPTRTFLTLLRTFDLQKTLQVSDGAAVCLLTTRAEALKRGLPILGVFRSFAAVGVDPAVMGIGPAVAIPAAVKMAGLTADDIDLYELNEAFASQVSRLGGCMRMVGSAEQGLRSWARRRACGGRGLRGAVVKHRVSAFCFLAPRALLSSAPFPPFLRTQVRTIFAHMPSLLYIQRARAHYRSRTLTKFTLLISFP